MRHANDSKLHFGDSVSGCYTQLTFADRRILHGVVDQKVSIIDIARRLGRHRSTMYREIRRNTFPHNQLPEYTGYFGTIVDELRREGGDVWGSCYALQIFVLKSSVTGGSVVARRDRRTLDVGKIELRPRMCRDQLLVRLQQGRL